ncbi:hypothetical protein B0H19DRAFT_1083269 [Mycena capillaripes]|nr:hypothetical protein B0H19DRAFT_1083269 [Mycena capillaripes]
MPYHHGNWPSSFRVLFPTGTTLGNPSALAASNVTLLINFALALTLTDGSHHPVTKVAVANEQANVKQNQVRILGKGMGGREAADQPLVFHKQHTVTWSFEEDTVKICQDAGIPSGFIKSINAPQHWDAMRELLPQRLLLSLYKITGVCPKPFTLLLWAFHPETVGARTPPELYGTKILDTLTINSNPQIHSTP